ncbi:hypothetical protein [uncultured Rikenella sp.]|uniref:hypothetical protein n=1 Tax=uncultured Rikenella sp. TaxID=368003 RepID=UPI0025F3F1E0|nr:hypothetical protein [uncultured Rikenella sp.]
MYRFLITTLLFVGAVSMLCHARERIDLAGEWKVELGGYPAATITLPGTTDAAGLGRPDTLRPALKQPQLLYLTRRHRYEGPATYSRTFELSSGMAGKPLELTLGRVLWRSAVSIDGTPVDGVGESLSTPHRFIIPPLSEGPHTISVTVDNSEQYAVSNGMAHCYTDHTQVKWNGILGDLSLSVVPDITISSARIYPSNDLEAARIVLTIDNNSSSAKQIRLDWDIVQLQGTSDGNVPRTGQRKAKLKTGENTVEWTVAMKGASTWSEFDPALYRLRASAGADTIAETFGMRSLESRDRQLLVNGRPVFLRGTLECCIFPLTGTPPMDAEGWEKEFNTLKEWGLNHFRFHSWCPPEAAFEVADRKGVYLQIELPLWNDVPEGPESLPTKRFLLAEYKRIIEEYGNHPSFMLMTAGNELSTDIGWITTLVDTMRTSDPRHLYAATSFCFDQGHGGHPEPNDQFMISQWTDDGWVRGQGMFDMESPTFNRDYSSAMAPATVPLISHEIGQYAVYPDLKETGLYIGTLAPRNFEAVAADLQAKGRLHRAEDYLQASGRLAALLYKEDIERAMRTPGISGYQLLGLQDFPGQGTALVGLVNAFWDSKGVASPSWFRQFAAPVVPLARFDRAVYSEHQPFAARIQVANYSPADLADAHVQWTITDSKGDTVTSGTMDRTPLVVGLNEAGKLEIAPGRLKGPDRMTLSITVETGDKSYANSWHIWIYPDHPALDTADIVLTRDIDEALAALAEGRKVLLSPSADSIVGMASHFVPVFWSPVHFPNQAGGMGLLVAANHPSLELFPTEIHTDWQWWHPLKRGRVIFSDSVAGATPIIEVVDNFTNNRALGMLYEANVGKGRLIISAFDLLAPELASSDDIASRQLLASILAYMRSERFVPGGNLAPTRLRTIAKQSKTSQRTCQ